MKKKLSVWIASSALILPLVSIAQPNPITCPSSLEYTCVEDPGCPKTRCTLTSPADTAPWGFLAPYKPLNQTHNDDRSSCSILPPGNYKTQYMVSIYGPADKMGDVGYCMYIDWSPEGLNFSGLYTQTYKNGKGDWKQADPAYPTLICTDAAHCEFVPK
jgi:hypothetical protein